MLPDTMYDYRHEQPQAEVKEVCSLSGNPIYQGETYYNFNGEVICEESLPEYLSYCKKEAE